LNIRHLQENKITLQVVLDLLAAQEGIEGLQILKKELCDSAEIDFDNIVKAIAKFSKHGYLMYGLRSQFTALPGGRASKEE
jgi:hypothetical protein